MRIDRIFTRNVVGTTRTANIMEAAAAMRRFHVGTLVVMDEDDGDRPVGIVTDRDLVLQAVAEGHSPREVYVGEMMSPIVATVDEGADLHEALERMRAAGVRRLLVTQANGAIAGILSADDVVDGLSADLASLARAVKSGIAAETAEYGGVGV
jgi:predicted transcriptional regulator